MKKNPLLYTGFLSPFFFWATYLICFLLTEDYNPLSNMVSELGVIGTSTQYIFTGGMALSALFSLAFIIGLFREARLLKISVIPILIIFTFSLFCAAIFPFPLPLHGTLGSLSIFLPLSPLITLFVWKNSSIAGIKRISAIAAGIMCLGFLVRFPDILSNYFGLKQLFFHVGWSFWFLSLGIVFIRNNK
jgi:hypothetical membrane protein